MNYWITMNSVRLCYVFMVKSILVAVGTEVPMSGTKTPVLRTCTLSEGQVSLK